MMIVPNHNNNNLYDGLLFTNIKAISTLCSIEMCNNVKRGASISIDITYAVDDVTILHVACLCVYKQISF
jgi:hypothetical protein